MLLLENTVYFTYENRPPEYQIDTWGMKMTCDFACHCLNKIYELLTIFSVRSTEGAYVQ